MTKLNTIFQYGSNEYEQFMAKASKGENLILSVCIQETATRKSTKIISTTDDELKVKADKQTTYSYGICTEYVPRQSIIDGKVQYLTDKIVADDKETAEEVFNRLADLIRVTKR